MQIFLQVICTNCFFFFFVPGVVIGVFGLHEDVGYIRKNTEFVLLQHKCRGNQAWCSGQHCSQQGGLVQPRFSLLLQGASARLPISVNSSHMISCADH